MLASWMTRIRAYSGGARQQPTWRLAALHGLVAIDTHGLQQQEEGAAAHAAAEGPAVWAGARPQADGPSAALLAPRHITRVGSSSRTPHCCWPLQPQPLLHPTPTMSVPQPAPALISGPPSSLCSHSSWQGRHTMYCSARCKGRQGGKEAQQASASHEPAAAGPSAPQGTAASTHRARAGRRPVGWRSRGADARVGAPGSQED